jgi:hypothetical protein
MKCYTVTEKGVASGVRLSQQPYPHIGVGDPANEPDYRLVEVDEALAAGDAVSACSVALDQDEARPRRAGYKLVPPAGDDNQALVKLEVHPGAGAQRTFYDLPRYTKTLAKGWFSKAGGPRVDTPVELVLLKKGDEVRVYNVEDSDRSPALLFTLSFDGAELKKS